VEFLVPENNHEDIAIMKNNKAVRIPAFITRESGLLIFRFIKSET
jgi:hypothetical protein